MLYIIIIICPVNALYNDHDYDHDHDQDHDLHTCTLPKPSSLVQNLAPSLHSVGRPASASPLEIQKNHHDDCDDGGDGGDSDDDGDYGDNDDCDDADDCVSDDANDDDKFDDNRADTDNKKNLEEEFWHLAFQLTIMMKLVKAMIISFDKIYW